MADTASVLRDLTCPLPEGTVIQERYKLLKAVGQGGFGITYIGWDKELRRNVAVKECFPVGLCYRDGYQLRPLNPQVEPYYLKALDDLMREARTLAALQHDRVVKVYDVVGGNGSIFCVMQWLQGGSLRERLAAREQNPITPEQAADWLAALLQALVYLHAHGVIHRDLKPENILFDEAGLPVIVDFGAALNKPQLTTSATRGAFSPGYAAPEQLTGKGEVGPWTDLFSLSATWYELLTGTRPETADKRLMEDDLIPLTSAKLLVPAPRPVLEMLQANLSLHPARRSKRAEDCLFWLRRGHAPNRLSAFLYRAALPLILTAAAAGGVVTYLLFPRETPAPQPTPPAEPVSAPATEPAAPAGNQAEIDAAAAALDKKLRDLYHVPELLADLQEIEPKMEALGDAVYEQEVKDCDRWLAEMDTQEFRDRWAFADRYDPPDESRPQSVGFINIAGVFFQRFRIKGSDCDHDFKLACERLINEKRRECEKSMLGTGELAKQYRPADFQEAAVLPTVAAQIDREVLAAMTQFEDTVNTYHYTGDYSEQCLKKAHEKWNRMVEADAAARPKELRALVNKLRAEADVAGRLKQQEDVKKRYQAQMAKAQQEEAAALKEFRPRISTLTTASDARALQSEIAERKRRLYYAYAEDIDGLVKESKKIDWAYRDKLSDLREYKGTPREKRLLNDALDALKDAVPESDAYKWPKPKFEDLEALKNEAVHA